MTRTLGALALCMALLTTGCADECEAVRTTPGDVTVGEFVYDNQCKQCHGEEGFGGSGADLVERLPTLNDCDLVDVIRGGGNSMPDFTKADISTEDLNDLLEYLTIEFR